MANRHIVIVDGLWVGHHRLYMSNFARVLLQAGYRVSVLCPAPGPLAEELAHAGTHAGDRFAAFYFAETTGRLPGYMPARLVPHVAALLRWLRVSAALREMENVRGKSDLVFFAWLDSYLGSRLVPGWLVDRLLPCRWSGLYFHPRHLRRGQGAKIRRFSPEKLLRTSKKACSVAILDAGVASAMRTGAGARKVYLFPDFTDETPPCEHSRLLQEITSRAKGRKIIGLLGSLTRRKGLVTLLETARQSTGRDWYFVIAGDLREETFSREELQIIRASAESSENCFFHPDRISDDSIFNALVKACDLVFAVYEEFLHSSNLVTKAAIFNKYVLVNTGGYMEEVVNRYRLGEAVPPRDVMAIQSALARLLEGAPASASVEGMKAFRESQSQAQLKQTMLELVECSLDLQAGASYRKELA